ncbi:M23 family metallopeptidase [Occultella aeris]|nr:M23 family metallopeptidase [Occultella aeris]
MTSSGAASSPPAPPTRRELRELERSPHRPSPGPGGLARQHLARASILLVLALVTIASPLVGLPRPPTPESGPPTPLAQTSALDVLADPGQPPMTTALAADPLASARTTAERVSRATERTSLTGTSGRYANGALAAAIPEQPAVIMPLAQGTYRETSQYGNRRDPITGGPSFHTGVDLAAPAGTPIMAVADGVVDYVGPGKDGRSSMLIVLRHEIDGQTIYTWYNHMYTSGLNVSEGQRVQAGDTIAGVGSNGNSTGPHLHFEVHLDNRLTTTEPLSWLLQQDAVDISELP